MSKSTTPKTKCDKCKRTIAKNHRFIHCTRCNSDVHIGCNDMDTKAYNKIKSENLPQICKLCLPNVLLEPNSLPSNQYAKIQCCECKRTIAKTHRFIKCFLCNSNVHIKCNKTEPKTYQKIMNENIKQICINCQPNCEPPSNLIGSDPTNTKASYDMPFQSLTDSQFSAENKTLVIETLPPKPIKKCPVCTKTIAKNHRHINCQSCKLQVHIACNQTDVKTYHQVMHENLTQICIKCSPKPPIIKTFCEVCTKRIGVNHRFINCSACNGKVHIKCNKMDLKTFKAINKDNSLICIKCQADNIPFQDLTDLQFLAVSKGLDTDSEALQEVSVTSTSLRTLFQEINKSSPFEQLDSEEDEGNATLINCKYTDLSSFNYKTQNNTFSLFHTNIGSLSKHKEELEVILKMLDVIGISETKLKNTMPKFDVNLTGYKCFRVDT